MLSEKQARYLQYLALQAGRSLEISQKGIILDKWKYPFSADESGYKNTEYNLQFDISFNRKYARKDA